MAKSSAIEILKANLDAKIGNALNEKQTNSKKDLTNRDRVNNTSKVKKDHEIIDKDINNTVANITESKDEEQTDPKKKIPKKSKSEKDKKSTFGIYLTAELDEELNKFNKDTNQSRNALMNIFMEEIFDKEKGNFKVEIEQNVKKKTRLTSILLNKDIIKAVKAGAKKTGWSESEYFNKIMEASISKYFK